LGLAGLAVVLRRPEESRGDYGPPQEGPPSTRCECGEIMVPAEAPSPGNPKASLAACGVLRCTRCGTIGTGAQLPPEVVAALRGGR
jgi:hypothetical protein